MLYPNGTRIRPHVSSPYGPRDPSIGVSSFHHGADLTGFRTIRAVAAGKVTFAGWMNDAAGNTVVIDHGNGVTSVYMHNRSITARTGNRVIEGGGIAVMGETGNASGPCCHLEIRVHGKSTEPLAYIQARITTTNPTPAGTPAPTLQEDEMIIRIKGKTGARRGGLYLIQGGKATFLGADPGQGFPVLEDEEQIAALQKRVSGIG